jgi:hypothetical protein
MTDEALIRPIDFKIPPVQINVNDYMGGPGRFATPDKFEVINKFFNPLTDISSFQLAPGEYSKAQLLALFKINGIVNIDQAQYSDGKLDVALNNRARSQK